MTRGGTDNLPHPPAVSAGMCVVVSASNQTGLYTRSNEPKVELLWGLAEEKVWHEPRLEACWTMLSAM